jgi:hypothetical protein
MPEINSSQPVSVGFATTDATQGTAATFDTSFWTDGCFTVLATVTARETVDSDEGAGYILAGTFLRTSGVTTLLGSVTAVHTAESTGGWAATMDVDSDGDNVRVRVTGASSTDIKWLTKMDVQVNDLTPYNALGNGVTFPP